MKPIGTLGILPAIGLIGWFICTSLSVRSHEKRLDILEHQQATSGIVVNGWDYQIIPNLFPVKASDFTNTEYK